MEKQEIIEGLKHAMERGYSLDVSISSFINAGYNRQDVLDSAKSISGSVLMPEIKPQMQQTQPMPRPIQQAIPQMPQTMQQPMPQTQMPPVPQYQSSQSQIVSQPPKKSHTMTIILLVLALIALIGGLITFITFF